MPENTAVLVPVEPLTPEEDAALKTLTLRKLRELAERNGWLTSPIAKSIFGLLAMLFLGAGASVVSRFVAPPPVVDPVVVVPTDETGKLIVAGFADLKATLGTGFADIKSLLDRNPPAPKPPEPVPPTPPSPDPDDWGEVILPLEVKADVGRMVVIEAKTKGECRWLIPPGSPCDRFESGKKLSLTPSAAVDFAVGVVSIPDGTVAWSRIKAAPPAPKPPEPKPPEPKPPTPPDPLPIPPAPISALTAKLQAAYKVDAAPPTIKDGQRKLLKGLYEAMVDHAKNPAIATTTDLLADLRTVSAQFVPATALVEMRKVISAEIVASIGTVPGAKLDPELRPKATEVFARIAKSLGEVQ